MLLGPRGEAWKLKPFQNCKLCYARTQFAGFCYGCLRANGEIDDMSGDRCEICCHPLPAGADCSNPLCGAHATDRVFGRVIAATSLTGIAAMVVHTLKPKADSGRTPKQHYASVLGSFLAGYATANRDNLLGYDLAMPMPAHPDRVREIGVDIPATLVTYLHRALGGSIAAYAGTDEIATKSRRVEARATGNSYRERREAVKDAYRLVPGCEPQLTGARVLVVDDVFTTGSNLNALAALLLAAGAGQVDGLVVARAQYAAHDADQDDWLG